jgi:hypothetical protein
MTVPRSPSDEVYGSGGSGGYSCKRRAMFTTLQHAFDLLARAGRWFDERFGWFFTNGMKQRGERSFRA